MTILQRYQNSRRRIYEQIDKSISPDLSRWQKLMIHLDFRAEKAFHGIALPNYFEYEFYGRNQKGRRAFACKRECRRIYAVCNPVECRYLTGDKAAFNRRFSQYLGRQWLDTATCSYEEFSAFIDGTQRFFIKPAKGECGIGNGVVDSDSILDRPSRFHEYAESNIIMEELICQHEELAEFNPESVNTIRVVTIRDAHEKVHVMAGVLRMGVKGSVVDNFHSHGICAVIDVKTGVVMSRGLDQDHKYYVVHPDSGKTIVGFQVPNWDRITELVKETAVLLPELRYIGWDIAIGQNGKLFLVEGNSTPDLDVTQAPDQVGKWAAYEPIINALEGEKGFCR